MSDHIHAVLSIPPRLAVAAIIGQLKGASSHRINEHYLSGTFECQQDYSVFNISESVLNKVVNCVNSQKKHHTERTLIDVLESTPD
jgi:putative transposase